MAPALAGSQLNPLWRFSINRSGCALAAVGAKNAMKSAEKRILGAFISIIVKNCSNGPGKEDQQPGSKIFDMTPVPGLVPSKL